MILIELKTPDRFLAKGLHFRDETLDVRSLTANAERLADEMTREGKVWRDRSGEQRPIVAGDVLESSKPAVSELIAIMRGHRAYVAGLGGKRP